MHKLPTIAVLALGSILTVTSLGHAYAESNSAADASAEAKLMNGAKISVTEAATAAETALSGKAVDVVLEATIGTLVYEVTLLQPDGSEVEATVDAMTGTAAKVLASEDQGGGQDGEQADGEQGGEGQDGGNAN